MPTLAEILRQTGYSQDGTLATPTPTDSPMTRVLSEHIKSLPQTTMQNLAKQRQDIDAALQMTPQGMQIADQSAFNRFMNEVPNVAALTAWHGTPHQIKGAFDISKVGTGEGAQAYGHGMYFAENPNVAKNYATDRSYVGKSIAGTPDKTPWDAQRIAQDTLNVHGDNAIEQLQKTLKANSYSKNPGQLDANKQLEDAIDILKTNQLQPTGNLYKVDIPDADIPKMLDYDKPLSQQPKAVQDALAKYDPDLYSPKGNDYDSNELGQSIYQRIVQDNVQKFGLGGNSKRASEDLNALGIKGIRYYDEGSRQAGGTSNFVVFDPSTVKILEENSKPVSRKEFIKQQVNKVLE